MRKQRGIVETFIAIVVLVLALVALFYYYQHTPHQKPSAPSAETSEPSPQQTIEPTESPSGVICTQEAKLCPDGKTYVSRTDPKCEFAACPTLRIPPESPIFEPRTCDENGENCHIGY